MSERDESTGWTGREDPCEIASKTADLYLVVNDNA